jgi:hypothetical protein
VHARFRAHGSHLRLDTGVLSSWDSISTSHTPFLASPGSASPLPPTHGWFRVSYPLLSPCRYPKGVCTSHYSRTLSNIGPRVPMQDCSCLGHPAFSAGRRSRVLQVFRLSLFPRSEGLPEELDRGEEMPYRSIFWSSVSAIFRWRPQTGQRD